MYRFVYGLAMSLVAGLTLYGPVCHAQVGYGQPNPERSAAAPLYQPVVSNNSLNYLLHLPAGYPDSEREYPLLLFLHGIAQKGDGSPESLARVAADGPFRTMQDGHWDESLPFIVVGPQSSGIQPWWRGEELRDLLMDLDGDYRIDASRRYLTGISMGGRAAWWLAKNFSNEFAALIPTSGWAGDLRRSCEVFRGMGIWAFHGARDPLIGLTAGRKPIEALNDCVPALTPEPRITVLKDAGHGQWQRIYANAHGDANTTADGSSTDDIYRWMLSFRKPHSPDLD